MEITLTADQAVLVRQAIEAGRIQQPEEAAEEAMALWQEYERSRAAAVPQGNTGADSMPQDVGTPAAAVARIMELRKGNVLPSGVTIRDLMSHGRA